MKDIKGYEGFYSVSKEGKVFSKWFNKIKPLKTWLIGRGYEMVMLYKNGKKPKKVLVHRLVAQAFIPNPKKFPEINHKDTNRLNNSVENLEWVTSKQNKQHAIKLGLYKNLGKNTPKGAKNKFAKLNDEKVREIRKRRQFETSRNIAEKFGVSYHLIDLICKHKAWKHIK